MWAARQAGMADREIVRCLAGTWSPEASLAVLEAAEWRAGVVRVLTEAGLVVGRMDSPAPSSGDVVDVRLSIVDVGRRELVADLGFAPRAPSNRFRESETVQEFGARVMAAAKQQWVDAVRRRAMVMVPALRAAGCRIFECNAGGITELTEGPAIDYLTAKVLVKVLISH